MKKDNYFIIFLKSFVVGLGIIFPISASYLAIGLGLYKRILDDINDLKTSIKKDFKFLLSVAIGIVFSALVSCLLVNFTLKRFPVATLLCFTGLIVGGIPELFKKTNRKYKVGNFIWMIAGICLLVGISFLKTSGDVVLATNAIGLLKIFGAGALAAGTMMIPGVSGSAILVIIGFYEPMLAVISETVKFTNLGTNIFKNVSLFIPAIVVPTEFKSLCSLKSFDIIIADNSDRGNLVDASTPKNPVERI